MIFKNRKKGKEKVLFLLPVLFLFFIFSIFLVSAVPPQETSEGWVVRSAIPDLFQKQDNIAYDFHAHVFDVTTGNPIVEDCVCYLHIYDIDGTHLFEGSDGTSSHDWDYSWDVNESLFEEEFEYPYIMQCNGTYATDDEGGFISSSFKVTTSGRGNLDAFWVLIFVIIFGTGLIIYGFAQEEHPPITLGAFIYFFVALYVWQYGFGTFGEGELISNIIAFSLFIIGATLSIKSLGDLK